jgi:hypothetical protein
MLAVLPPVKHSFCSFSIAFVQVVRMATAVHVSRVAAYGRVEVDGVH